MEQTPPEWQRIADGEHAVLALAEMRDPGDIERIEQADGSVRYTDILLLAPGIWTDANSRKQVWYSPEGIQASADNWEDNTLNLLHAQEDEALEIGAVDTDSVYLDDASNLYADLELHRDNDASRLADESLQTALESEGGAGIDGPSVELRGDTYRPAEERDALELVEGAFQGVGLVGLGITAGPASKPADFSRQTAGRAVALADGDVDPTVYTKDDMNDDELRALLAEAGVAVDDDLDADTVHALAAAHDDLEQTDDGSFRLATDEDGEEMDDDDEADDGDGDDEEMDDDDDEMEMAERVGELQDAIASLEERLQTIEDEHEQLVNSDASLADLDETVAELAEDLEARPDPTERLSALDERLSALEDEPEEPKSLAADAMLADADSEDSKTTTAWGETPRTYH